MTTKPYFVTIPVSSFTASDSWEHWTWAGRWLEMFVGSPQQPAEIFLDHTQGTQAAVISHLPSLRTDSPELLPWVRLHCLQEHPAATLTCLGCLEYSQKEVLGNLRAETFQDPISYMHNFGNSPQHQRKNAIYLQTVTVGHVKTTGTNSSFKSFL